MIAFQPLIAASGPNLAAVSPDPAVTAAQIGSDAAAEFASLLASLAGDAVPAGMCVPAETPAAARPQQGPAREKDKGEEAELRPALAAPVAIPVPPPAPAPPPEGVFDPFGAEPAVLEAACTAAPNAAEPVEHVGTPGRQPAAPVRAAATTPIEAPAPVQPVPPRVFEPAPAPPRALQDVEPDLRPEAPPPKTNGQERRELAFHMKLDDSGAVTPDRTVAVAPTPRQPAPEVEQRGPQLKPQNPAADLPAKAAAVSPRAPEQLELKSAEAPARAVQSSAGQPAATHMPAHELKSADAPPRPAGSSSQPAPARQLALSDTPALDSNTREPGKQADRDAAEQPAAPRSAATTHPEEAASSAPRSPHAAAQTNPAPAAPEAGRPAPVREPAAPPRTEAPRPPEPRVIEEPAPPAARQPLRDLSVVVPDRRGETRSAGDVELRITERGGRVQVAVHTADPALKDSLREHLPELVSRLEETGYRAQTWRPDTAGESVRTPAAAAAAETAGRESGDRSGRESSGGSGGGQPGNPEHRDRRQDERGPHPRWIEALEDNLDEKSARSFSYVR